MCPVCCLTSLVSKVSVTGAGWLTAPALRLADLLAVELGTNNDELLYQSARKLVIIEMQHIVYTEFLPTLLGMTHLQLECNLNHSNFCSKLLNYTHRMFKDILSDGTLTSMRVFLLSLAVMCLL